MWDKEVVNRQISDRSYEIETAKGTFIRNRVHLRKTKEVSFVPTKNKGLESSKNGEQRSENKELESFKLIERNISKDPIKRHLSPDPVTPNGIKVNTMIRESRNGTETVKEAKMQDVAKNSPVKPMIETRALYHSTSERRALPI